MKFPDFTVHAKCGIRYQASSIIPCLVIGEVKSEGGTVKGEGMVPGVAFQCSGTIVTLPASEVDRITVNPEPSFAPHVSPDP